MVWLQARGCRALRLGRSRMRVPETRRRRDGHPFLTTTSGSEGVTHLIVDRLDTAKKSFASAGLAYTEADVLQLELPNTPGALAKFARKLGDEDINITLGYATGGKGSRKTTVVLAVSDLDKAA